MSWLERFTPFRRGGAALAEREEQGARDAVAVKRNPPLMLLVNDASGRASFKTHVFESAEEATDFVLYWFPKQSEGGILAFWAMTQEPQFGLDNPSETETEALVMIRDVNRDGVVYLFSFVDMSTAQEFLRQEVHHGTELGLMMLYWAVPVRLTSDPWGRMMLTPSTPPGSTPQLEGDAPVDEGSPPPAMPTVESPKPAEKPVDVFEEAPNARTGVADPMGGIDETFELTSWVDRPRKKSKQAPEVEPEANAGFKRRARRAPREEREVRLEPAFDMDAEPAVSQMEFAAAGGHSEALAEPEGAGTVEPEPAPAQVEFAHAGEPETPPAPEVMESIVEREPAERETADVEDRTKNEVSETAVEPARPQVEIVEGEDADETPAELEVTRDQGADAPEEVAPSIHNAAGESLPVPDPTPAHSPAEVDAAPDALEPDVLRKKMRARTNGNGHKPLPAEGRKNGAMTSNHIVAEVQVNGDAQSIIIRDREEAPPEQNQTSEITFGEETPEGKVEAENSGNGHVGDSIEIRIDIHLASSKALKVKRWEVKEEPFEGFDSPPGRF